MTRSKEDEDIRRRKEKVYFLFMSLIQIINVTCALFQISRRKTGMSYEMVRDTKTQGRKKKVCSRENCMCVYIFNSIQLFNSIQFNSCQKETIIRSRLWGSKLIHRSSYPIIPNLFIHSNIDYVRRKREKGIYIEWGWDADEVGAAVVEVVGSTVGLWDWLWKAGLIALW